RVLEFAPTERRKMWTYATCCMSQPTDTTPIELHIFSSQKDVNLVELLTVVAYYHKTSSKIGLHHTVNFGRPWQDTSLCEYGFVSLPFLDGPDLENLYLPGNKTIKFYWLIPVTKSEVEFKSRYGIEALEQKFDSKNLDYLNPRRLS